MLALLLYLQGTLSLRAACQLHRRALPDGRIVSTAASCSNRGRPLFALLPDHPDDIAEDLDFEAKLASLATAPELAHLRERIDLLQRKLEHAAREEDFVAAAGLRDRVRSLEARHPDVLAAALREQLNEHVQREQYAEAVRLKYQLTVLRRFQPQYQLAGLWEGTYPNNGRETIRIHYQHEKLYAVKLTGDEHVPAGEVTFQAELSSSVCEEPSSVDLEPQSDDELVGVGVQMVSVSADGEAQQHEAERFAGEGCVAARGFQHAHFVPGQLFVMEEGVLGFLWMPLGTMVIFRRLEGAE